MPFPVTLMQNRTQQARLDFKLVTPSQMPALTAGTLSIQMHLFRTPGYRMNIEFRKHFCVNRSVGDSRYALEIRMRNIGFDTDR